MHSLIVENVEEQKEENTNYVLSFDPAITTVNILTNFTKMSFTGISKMFCRKVKKGRRSLSFSRHLQLGVVGTTVYFSK